MVVFNKSVEFPKNRALRLECNAIYYYFALVEELKKSNRERQLLNYIYISFLNMICFCDNEDDLIDIDKYFMSISCIYESSCKFYDSYGYFINNRDKAIEELGRIMDIKKLVLK